MKWQGEKLEKLIELYQSGMSCREVAERLNTSKSVVWRCLTRNNIQMREKYAIHKRDMRWKGAELQLAITLYASGLSVRNVAKYLKVSKAVIENVFKKNKVQLRPPSVLNLVGHTFGLLTVTSRGNADSKGNAFWYCECACGNKAIVTTPHLKYGSTRTCGCNRSIYTPQMLRRFLGWDQETCSFPLCGKPINKHAKSGKDWHLCHYHNHLRRQAMYDSLKRQEKILNGITI